MNLTEGKKQGMAAVSSKGGFLGKDGIIGAAAMDQRGSLKKAIGQARGIEKDQVPAEDMTEFKTAVTKVLTQHATAVLLDPEFALPSLKAVDPKAGVLLAYEKSGYDQTGPGRLPTLLPDWNVAKIKEAAAAAQVEGDARDPLAELRLRDVLRVAREEQRAEERDVEHALVIGDQ